jgi:hypothetical protein
MQKLLDIHFLIDTGNAVRQHPFSFLEELIVFGDTAFTAGAYEAAP